MPYIARNDALSVLAGDIAIDATSLTLATGHGDLRFPPLPAGSFTYVTVEDSTGATEPMKVTARSGDVLTLARGASSGITPVPVPRAWSAGALVEIRPLAHLVQDPFNHVAQDTTAHAASAIGVTPAGGLSATNVQAALEELDAEKLSRAAGGAIDGDVDLRGGVALDGAAGNAGQVMVSRGAGNTPAWGATPPEFSTTTTGAGDIAIPASSNGVIDDILARAVGGVVDYRIYSDSQYETGTGIAFRSTDTFDSFYDSTNGLLGKAVNGMASNGVVTVAVADGGRIVTSTDGQVWTPRQSGTTLDLKAVTWDGVRFIAVGGGEKIIASSDGITWTFLNNKVAISTGLDTQGTDGATTALVFSSYTTGPVPYGYTLDGGATWLEGYLPVEFGYPWSAPLWDGSGYLMITSTRLVIRTTDCVNWVRWSTVDSSYNNGAELHKFGAVIASRYGQAFYTSADGGKSWTKQTLPISVSGGVSNGAVLLIVDTGTTSARYTADGVNWTVGTLPATGLAFQSAANGVFFLASGSASSSVYTSPDGATWSTRTMPSSQTWMYFTWNGTNYVGFASRAAGSAGVAATSTNLSSWTGRTFAAGGSPRRIFTIGTKVFINGYVYQAAVGATHLGALYVSTDSGATYSDVTFQYFGSQTLTGVAYSPGIGKHVVVGAYGALITSADAFASMTRAAVSALGAGSAGPAVAADNAVFVLAAQAGALHTSTDGTNWTSRTSTFGAQQIRGVAHNGAGLWLVVGDNGQAAYSPDTINWTAAAPGLSTYKIYCCYWDGSAFLIAGDYGALAKSSDAVTWTNLTPVSKMPAAANVGFRSGCAFGSVRLLGATFGNFVLSTDTATWVLTDGSSGFHATVYGVAYGAGVYVAVGTYGLIATSTDGLKWTQRTNPFAVTDNLNGVEFLGGKFIAYGGTSGSATRLATSADGVTWTMQGSAATALGGAVNGVAYSGSVYCAVDSSGNFATSTDAVTWTARGNASSASVKYGLSYGAGMFWCFYSLLSAVLQFSSDGITWNSVTLPFNASRGGYSGGKFWMAGTYDLRLSDDGLTWDLAPMVTGTTGYTYFYLSAGGVQMSQAWGVGASGAIGFSADNGQTFSSFNPGVLVQGAAYLNGRYFLRGAFLVSAPAGNKTLRLNRTSVVASSNGGSLVPLAAGAKSVSLYPATAPAIGALAEFAGTAKYGTWLPANGADIDLRTYKAASVLPASTALHLDTVRYLPVGFSPVAYGAGVFVARSSSSVNYFYSSADGITWTKRTLPATASWYAPVWNGSVFVATQNTATTTYATSADGITWTSRTSLPSASHKVIKTLNGKFYAGLFSSGTIYYSTDGITWAVTTTFTAAGLDGVSFAMIGATYVAVLSGTTSYTSADGITWTARTTPSGSWIGVVSNGAVLLAYQNGSTAAITSPDGVTWTSRTLPEPPSSGSAPLAAIGSVFIYTGSYNTSNTYYSGDGISWTTVASTASGISGWKAGVWAAGNRAVIVAQNNICSTTDGANWTVETAPVASNVWYGYSAVVYGDRLLAGDGNGCLLVGRSPYWVTLPSITQRSAVTPPKVRVA